MSMRYKSLREPVQRDATRHALDRRIVLTLHKARLSFMSWERFWKDSVRNMDLANSIVESKQYDHLGLAAYHAQLGLEMAVKSGMYRFGFDEYLRMRTVGVFAGEIALERDKNRRGDPMKTHFPTGELALPPIDFLDYQLEKMLEKGTGMAEMDASLRRMKSTINTIRELVEYISPPKLRDGMNKELIEKRKEELWKLSLSMNIQDRKLQELINRIKSSVDSGGEIPQFVDSGLSFVSREMQRQLGILRKRENEELLRDYEERVLHLLQRADLPLEIYYYLRDNDMIRYRQLATELTSSRGIWTMVIKLTAHQTEMMKLAEELESRKKGDLHLVRTVPLPMARLKFIWMSFFVAIAYVMFFMYPHEEIGRYSRQIDGRDSNDLYSERKSEVEGLIGKCKEACDVIKQLL